MNLSKMGSAGHLSEWRALGSLFLLFVIAVLSPGCRADHDGTLTSARVTPGPNVVLVTIDTLRADHVGCYGDSRAETSTLDELAVGGTVYETAISSAPLTLPAHASILTGLYPPHHGVRHNGLYRLPDSVETLADRFRDAGYATGAVMGAAVLSKRYGLDQGFDFYDDTFSATRAAASGFYERRASDVVQTASAWVSQVAGPFFLWVHFYDPHVDYQPPGAYAKRFRTNPYDGEIAFVDDQLEVLFDVLRARGVFDQTIFVVTADHGESLGEHREQDHGYTLYDATLRVPLIFHGPGIPEGERVAGVVRSVDIAPTILAMVGLPPLPDVDGIELPDLGLAVKGGERFAYAETLATKLDYGWSPLYAIRSNTQLFILAPRPELFSVAEDPGQLDNLLGPNAQPVSNALAADLKRRLGEMLGEEKQGAKVALDSSEIERLRALGYVVPETSIEFSGLDPKDGLPLLSKFRDATILYNQGDLQRAVSLLRSVVEDLPQSAQVRWLYGLALSRTGKPREGLPQFEEAARLSPRSARYRAMVAEVRRQLGDVEGAVANFKAAAALDPSEPQVQVGLAWIAWQSGDRTAAIAHARRAASEGALEPAIQMRLAELWAENGLREEAVKSLRVVLRLRPNYVPVRMLLAAELARLGRIQESEMERRRLGPRGVAPDYALQLGDVYEEAGAFVAAERLYQDALASRDDPRVRNALAKLPLEHR